MTPHPIPPVSDPVVLLSLLVLPWLARALRLPQLGWALAGPSLVLGALFLWLTGNYGRVGCDVSRASAFFLTLGFGAALAARRCLPTALTLADFHPARQP